MSWRRMKLTLMNCFKHISNGVLLGNGSNYPCGDTCCKRIGGDIPCYNTSCSNNTVISYCYAWTHNHISAKPAIISNGYRLGITQKAFYTIAAKHSSAFFSDHRMQGSDNGYIWPEIIVISYRYYGIILHGKIEIHKAMCANFCVATIVKVNRSKHKCAFANFR